MATDAWSCELAVLVDGMPVGCQGLGAEEFPTLRRFESGSWLGQSYQRQGIGKEMRAAILHFGFSGLGAAAATTGCFDDNAASLGVTRALGYRANGELVQLRRGEPARQLRFVMERAEWEARRRDDIEIEGLESCLRLFGIDTPTGEP